MHFTRAAMLTATLVLGTSLAACSLAGDEDSDVPEPTTDAREGASGDDESSEVNTQTDEADDTQADEGSDEDSPAPTASDEVVLITHDSFYLPEEIFAEFTAQTGYRVTHQASGSAGEMTNQLVLTAGRPIGDVVFGIDTTFASRAVNEEVLAPYTPAVVPAAIQEHFLPDEGAAYLTPVDYSDVCVNIDTAWFAQRGMVPPSDLSDLTDPAYADLFVTPGASTSSPGMAFLLATIGEFGPQGWEGYWSDLMANGAKVTSGWTDAYTVDFTAGGGQGERPIVLSYASSPPSTIPEGGWQPTTQALLDTCFRQVEYAGVLQGAANPEGAQALVDFLIGDEVQAAVPESMWMYPVSDSVMLPQEWDQWAPVAQDPIVVHPQQIEESREDWVRTWADLATG